MADEKRSLLQAYRAAKAESGISMRRLFATALAAVTMALISSRLTSVLNSLILVAVVSIGSALIGEAYRILLSVTAEGTKKVAETTKKVIVPIVHPDDMHARSSESDETQVIDRSGVDETRILHAAQQAEVVEVVSTEVRTEPESPQEGDGEKRKSPLRTSQYVQLAVVFGIVSLITVGASYAVARTQGHTDITYNYSAAQNRPLETLTPEQQQILADMAVSSDPSASTGGTTADGPESGEASGTPSENLDIIEGELANLTAQNEALQSAVNDLRTALESETTKTEELARRISELEALLTDAGVSVPESQTGTGPSRSTTDSG